MKQVFAALLLVFGFNLEAQASPEIGKIAPSFSGTTSAGETISLNALKGKKVVLEWTNHDCPFVVKHYTSGNMQRTQSTLRNDDYVWIQVISSAPGKQGHVSPAKADELNQQRGAYVDHVLLDPEGTAGHAYGAKTTPHMYIIDGELVLQYMGAIDSIRSARISDIERATNYVLAVHEALESGQPVAETSTRAYGCTIKYK